MNDECKNNNNNKQEPFESSQPELVLMGSVWYDVMMYVMHIS